MKKTPFSRFVSSMGLAALLSASSSVTSRAGTFPAINESSTSDRHPGKLIWADLFTTDPETATKFYCGALGWTADDIEQHGKGYTVFRNQGVPVAGLAPRSAKGAGHPSRWIGYFAVVNIEVSLASAVKAGGIVRAPAKTFPRRGLQAIISDNENIPVGLLQSSSGDPPDSSPIPGAWNWFEFYVKDPVSTSDFYKNVVGLSVVPETKADRKSDFLLSSDGHQRGGVAVLPNGDDTKPSWLGVVRVADLDKTLVRVHTLGGEVLVAPHSVEYGSRFAIILDPTGGTLGLVEYSEEANPANNP